VREPTARYPVGAGSAVIFRSMPWNSRRVRWFSANFQITGVVSSTRLSRLATLLKAVATFY